MQRTGRKQKLVVGALAAAGVALATIAGIFFVNTCRLRFAENLVLRAKPRSESHWQLTETRRGHLIRVRKGKFKGWYLAADDLVNAVTPPGITFITGSRVRGSEYARNLILRERAGDGCYWKLTDTSQGVLIQATHGRYNGWYLDFLAEYVPDVGRDPPTAWNLVLNKELVEGAYWRVTQTDGGHLIQATVDRFKDWYLDALLDAKVLERNTCWGDETRRDRPTPPLLK